MSRSAYADRGRLLELATLRGALEYRKLGRCALSRQHVATAWGRDGGLVRVGSAPIDALGCLAGGRALAVECKQVTSGELLPLARFDELQRGALDRLHQLGAMTLVVVGFMAELECYACPWERLASFMASPWRQSVSRSWCRAHGLLVPCHCAKGELRSVAFLDGQPHPARDVALAEVAAERAAAVARPKSDTLSHSPAEPEPSPVREIPQSAGFASLTPAERADRIIAAVSDGIGRQLRRHRRWRRP